MPELYYIIFLLIFPLNLAYHSYLFFFSSISHVETIRHAQTTEETDETSLKYTPWIRENQTEGSEDGEQTGRELTTTLLYKNITHTA